MIKRSLYDILGVKVDASEAQIKRAFRRLVKRAHPDVGGNPEQFWEIQNAYEVLSDPVRRQRYNETGQGEDPKMTDSVQKAAMILSQLVLDLMNANPQGCNVVAGATNMLKTRIQAIRSAVETDLQRERTLRGIADLVEKKGGGDNLIAAVIISHADGCKGNSERLSKEADGLVDVLKMLGDYSWKPDNEQRSRTNLQEIRAQFTPYHFLHNG